MSKFEEVLIEFLRSEGHQLEIDVKPSSKFTCSKVYFNRDPSGVLRGSALTVIQADQRLAYASWKVVGSPIVLMEKRRMLVIEAAVIGTTCHGANLLHLKAIRCLRYHITEIETYCIEDRDANIVFATSGAKLISKLKQFNLELSQLDIDALLDLAPIQTNSINRRPLVRYAPTYYYETDRFFASLPEANSRPV